MKKEYLKNESKAIITQTHEVNKTNDKVSEMTALLRSLENEQRDNDKILDDMLDFANEFINVNSSNIVTEEFLSYNFEYSSSSLSNTIISELDSIEFKDDISFSEYFQNVETYAERNDINLELEYQKMFAFESIELIKVKEGKGPIVICIDCFLSQDKSENMQDWLSNMPSEFKEYTIYYCKWESKKLFDIIMKFFTLPIEEVFKHGSVVAVWKTAVENSIQAGRSLAGMIHKEKHEYILIGHSLGASVINECLNSLSDKSNCTILEAHLLGGAVGSSSSLWSKPSDFLRGKIYNYMSDNDKVLQVLYRIGESDIWDLTKPVGRNKIYLSSVANIDLTYLINSHSGYRNNLSSFLYSEKKYC